MSQPVKLSAELVLDARLTGEVMERSIAGQIEFWARLGRALEPFLRTDQAMALRRAGDTTPLSECLQTVDSPEGKARVAEFLRRRPYPHYEQANEPGLIVRVDADGTKTVGRFVNREFRRVKSRKKR